jgi:UDP-N-acetylglucosamine transferase subunit ALG13
MIGENINIPSKPLRVLVSPLHWGLGHATRIIPVIKVLQDEGVQVLLAANGPQAILLRAAFPQLEMIPAPAFEMVYPRESKWFFLKMLLQSPAILSAIRQEKKWLHKLVAENRIDAVISDNRFGLHHQKIPSVFITHQLFINAPQGILRRLAQKINYLYIRQFGACWVPDVEEGAGLAGKLSHPAIRPPVSVDYIGPLSRLKPTAAPGNHLLILLSGPEPQRSIWEKNLLQQLPALDKRVVLVRGLPGNTQELQVAGDTTVYSYADSGLLSELICGASMVIARCGYSTVMDLVALGKKAILVPTPGQGEQEYLATHLKNENMFYTLSQEGFNMQVALREADGFEFNLPNMNFNEMHTRVIRHWLQGLRVADQR